MKTPPALLRFAFPSMLSSLFIGFSMGVAPVISFRLGRGNRARLKAVLAASALVWRQGLTEKLQKAGGA